jgi:hypothetical protein
MPALGERPARVVPAAYGDEMAQWIADVLLLAALAAAFWYAWETRRMRLQMIRPKLVFLTRQHRPEQMGDKTAVDLFVRNVGEGTAINVSLDPVRDEAFEMRADPDHIAVLEKGQEVKLAIRPAAGSHKPDMSLILEDSSISLRLLARYVDVEGGEFCTSTAVGAGATPPLIKDERK